MLIFLALLSLSPILCIAEPNLHVAVVEYQPILNNVNANADEYIKIIETFKNKKLNLILFPESTLTYGMLGNLLNYSTIAQENETPCDLKTYPDFIQKLSCSAQSAGTYLVINVIESSVCPESDKTNDNCKQFGSYFYNTDIIFDKTGKIIAKYRKYNLFGEHPLDTPPEETNDVTFDVEDTKFGIFTCFDILFKSPAEKLIYKDKVENFLYPSMWFSELPFLTALQTQQMWTYSHNVTLFSAGASNPKVGSGGTAIFDGYKGSLDLTIKSEDNPASAQTLQYPVIKPISSEPFKDSDLDNFRLKQDPSILNANFTVLEPGKVQTNLCYNELCCNFDIETEAIKSSPTASEDTFSYTYLLVAYTGVRSFSGVYNGGVDFCGVVACLDKTLATCGVRYEHSDKIAWPFTWTKLEITTEVQGVENRTQYPNSVLQSLRPIHPKNTDWSRQIDENSANISFSLTNQEKNNEILTFAVYGRNFNLDSPPDNGNSSYYLVNILLLISAFLFAKLLK